MDPETVLAAMTAAMEVIGRRFACSEIYVPEMLISARAMKEATAVLEPVLDGRRRAPGAHRGHRDDEGRPPRHRQEPGGDDVEGRQHRGRRPGHERVRRRQFVEAAREHGASIVGVSALLTTTMVGMKDVVAAVRAGGLGDVKVIVGGAPVTAEYAAIDRRRWVCPRRRHRGPGRQDGGRDGVGQVAAGRRGSDRAPLPRRAVARRPVGPRGGPRGGRAGQNRRRAATGDAAHHLSCGRPGDAAHHRSVLRSTWRRPCRERSRVRRRCPWTTHGCRPSARRTDRAADMARSAYRGRRGR